MFHFLSSFSFFLFFFIYRFTCSDREHLKLAYHCCEKWIKCVDLKKYVNSMSGDKVSKNCMFATLYVVFELQSKSLRVTPENVVEMFMFSLAEFSREVQKRGALWEEHFSSMSETSLKMNLKLVRV